MKRILTIGIILLFIGMSISSSTGFNTGEQSNIPISNGKTLYVGGSGPGNYSKIQDAIDNASDGDTVFVYNGTYVENVVLNTSVNLIGEDRNITVINSSGIGDVVYVSADNVTISGFTIQNSKSDFSYSIRILSDYNTITSNIIISNQYGIYIYSSNNHIIRSNNITSNSIGIKILKSNIINILDNNILNNFIGLSFEESNNIKVKGNTIASQDKTGIRVCKSNHNIITANTILNNKYALWIEESSYNNTISDNNVTSNMEGIMITHGSRYNIVVGNNVNYNSGSGIIVGSNSAHNTVIGNTATGNKRHGISLAGYSKYNKITNNTITSNHWRGIELHYASKNIISRNTISKNDLGIWLRDSNSITIEGNVFINNGLYLYGSTNNYVANNTINGKPLVYLENKRDVIINVDSGQVVLIKCDNITIKNQIISKTSAGILLYKTQNCSIFGNSISNCYFGISIGYSNNNNFIYHNDFIKNQYNLEDFYKENNTWDNGYPSGGNYWDDYKGVDNFSGPNQDVPGSDGIGDTPYKKRDRYPLMEPYGQTVFEIGIISGGLFKIKAEIKNIGRYNATEVNWTIRILRSLLPLINEWSGEIKIINPNKSEIVTTGFLIGFGKYKITVTAEASNALNVSKSINGYIILFLILIKQ